MKRSFNVISVAVGIILLSAPQYLIASDKMPSEIMTAAEDGLIKVKTEKGLSNAFPGDGFETCDISDKKLMTVPWAKPSKRSIGTR